MPPTTKREPAELKQPVGKWFELPVKIALSGMAVFFFILVLHLMQLWYATSSLLANASNNLANTTRPIETQFNSAGEVETFWPHFPGSSKSTVHRMNINGVDTISEDWQTSAAGADVIAFYREQMLARRWQDDTEEQLELKPENHSSGWANNGLQNPEYVRKYRTVMDSSLILYRAPWSLQITAVPSEKSPRQTNVRLLAATTPSIKDFYLNMGDTAFNADAPSQDVRPIDTVQESGGQRYHTVIAIKNEEPAWVFSEMLKEYSDKNWHPMIFNPSQQRPSDFCAWLVNGRSYAALSVKATPQGNHSTVTLTEVSPDSN